MVYRYVEENGIWAYDVEHREMVLVTTAVLAMLGDNPMQSEFACHVGLRGKFFCRCCWAKGFDAAEVEAEADDDDEDDSGGSERSSIGAGNQSRKKHFETLSAMISRVTRFMKVCFPYLSCSMVDMISFYH